MTELVGFDVGVVSSRRPPNCIPSPLGGAFRSRCDGAELLVVTGKKLIPAADEIAGAVCNGAGDRP